MTELAWQDNVHLVRPATPAKESKWRSPTGSAKSTTFTLMTVKGSKVHDSKDDGGPLCRWAGHSYEATYYPTRKPVNCKDCLAKTN